MISQAEKNQTVCFFGCPLDCDEKYDSIQEKQTIIRSPGESDDPFDHVMRIIRDEVPGDRWQELGCVPVPEWLRPIPASGYRSLVSAENIVAWMDDGGCRKMAGKVENFVAELILPAVPCLIGVDHSITGGSFRALTSRYGTEAVSLIILDSHTDAVPMANLTEAIQYDVENNPDSVHDANDPLLYNRPDAYNASSFVHHMVQEESVAPENLYIIGTSDFPDKRAMKIKDPRIRRYINVYTDLRRQGAKIITKNALKTGTTKLKTLLRQIDTPYVYVSIDMDIGAANALEGVRFLNYKGLAEKQIHNIADAISAILSDEIHLAGIDVMEFNARRAGEVLDSGLDRTYRIAADLIKKIAFRMG